MSEVGKGSSPTRRTSAGERWMIRAKLNQAELKQELHYAENSRHVGNDLVFIMKHNSNKRGVCRKSFGVSTPELLELREAGAARSC